MSGLLELLHRRRAPIGAGVLLLFASCAHSVWRVGEVSPLPGDSLALLGTPVVVPPPIPREFRGVWISPVEHGEWPSRPGLPAAQQQAELRGLFDRARDIGLNAVVFHVRTGADALYPSRTEPWSAYLTGELGKPPSPAYDPVAFAVQEAHARGLQFHAWFNPFRVSPPMKAARNTPGHMATEHPEWVVRYGDQLWIDPGIPAARRAVLDAILEVVDRYDIDAVHLDDYFYPYLEEHAVRKRVKRGKRWRRITVHETIRFADAGSWRKYGVADGWDDRADWRRHNIDEFVRQLYTEVKAHKRWVEVGISPFGIWRPDHPAGITGLDAYAEIFADSRKWLREGWLDYIAPQLYWPVDGAQSRFTRLDAWWRSQNRLERHIWPGIFTAGAATRSGRWPAADIVDAVDTIRAVRRASRESTGEIHFRLKSLLPDAPGGVGAALRSQVYRDGAVPPASPWLAGAAPAPPRVTAGMLADHLLLGERVDDAAGARAAAKGAPSVSVAPGDAVPVRWWVVQLRDGGGRWHTSVHPGTVRSLTLALPDGSPPAAAAVTALSQTGVASQPAIADLGRR